MARDEDSKVDSLDHRFALVDVSGVERYPCRMKKRDGQFGFLLGRERDGQGVVVQTIEQVVRGVVFEGQQVRTSDFPPTTSRRCNGLSLAASREVQGYRIDPSLQHLVACALGQPMGAPIGGALTGAPSAHIPSPKPARGRVDALSRLDALPLTAYAAALQAVEPQMTQAQREMLRGHGNAPAQKLSMQDIAEHGGYSRYATANIQYGRLGRMFAEALDVDHAQLANKVQAICFAAGGGDESGHFLWRLRPQLAGALNEAGWGEPEPAPSDTFAAFGAAAELAADEKCKGLSETTRRALINARIGQGGFRQRMLKVWGGRCSVTGLGIEQALTASHALAWKDSDNRERLDEYNGLLLSATVDRLFDRGLISFTDAGSLLVHPCIVSEELEAAGLTTNSRLRHVPTRCIPYLRAHRGRFMFGV